MSIIYKKKLIEDKEVDQNFLGLAEDANEDLWLFTAFHAIALDGLECYSKEHAINKWDFTPYNKEVTIQNV